jgi:hypothetical protein
MEFLVPNKTSVRAIKTSRSSANFLILSYKPKIPGKVSDVYTKEFRASINEHLNALSPWPMPGEYTLKFNSVNNFSSYQSSN